MIGRVFCHPIDTVKARLQASTTASRQSMATHLQLRNLSYATTTAAWLIVVVRILTTCARTYSWTSWQHLRGLYRGLGVSMIGSAPATCLYLTSYEVSKDSLQSVPVFRDSPSLLYLGAGMLAEALSCVLWVPIDVIKERMQVQTLAAKGPERVYYRSTVHAVETIMKTERLSGLYKGYAATLLSFGPFSALYFMLYEKVRTW